MESRPPDLTVGFPRESGSERRTICTPEVARALVDAGFGVITEPGIGERVFIGDDAYIAAGAHFTGSAEVWAAPLVLRYKSPDPADLHRLTPGHHIGALFHAEGDPELMAALRACRATAWSYEFVEQDGRFPLSRPGGQIAGVQAVLAGAQALQHPAGRGVLLGPVDGAPRVNVVIIGSGNVGAAAARTAVALGGHVVVLTSGQASRDVYAVVAPVGVRVVVNTREALLTCLRDADLVIGAILVSTYDTPVMIGAEDLKVMRPGAVIVDATCGYGSGYLPTAGLVQQPGEPPHVAGGILHVKVDVWPALVPVTATAAYSGNAVLYLVRLARAALLGHHDSALQSAVIARDGNLVHPVLLQHAGFYRVQP